MSREIDLRILVGSDTSKSIISSLSTNKKKKIKNVNKYLRYDNKFNTKFLDAEFTEMVNLAEDKTIIEFKYDKYVMMELCDEYYGFFKAGLVKKIGKNELIRHSLNELDIFEELDTIAYMILDKCGELCITYDTVEPRRVSKEDARKFRDFFYIESDGLVEFIESKKREYMYIMDLMRYLKMLNVTSANMLNKTLFPIYVESLYGTDKRDIVNRYKTYMYDLNTIFIYFIKSIFDPIYNYIIKNIQEYIPEGDNEIDINLVSCNSYRILLNSQVINKALHEERYRVNKRETDKDIRLNITLDWGKDYNFVFDTNVIEVDMQ